MPTTKSPSPAGSQDFFHRLETRISLARWCAPATGDSAHASPPTPDFSAARIPALMPPQNQDGHVYWLDRLLGGGIALPARSSEPKALSLLLSGPPGSGKSTLAMEMAYRWAESHRVLYLTSEAPAEFLIEKALSYGWTDARQRFHEAEQRGDGVRVVSIQGMERESPLRSSSEPARSSGILAKVNDLLLRLADDALPSGPPPAPSALPALPPGHPAGRVVHESPTFTIAIVDSLNSGSVEESSALFRDYLQLLSTGPQLVLVVLDTPGEFGVSPFWEYVCDIALRVDRRYVHDAYMTRWLEVVKARYQQHAWGRHQLKIYEPPQLATRVGEDAEAHRARLLRAFPYSTEGGVFVFPSIHYVLSQYKRSAAHRDPSPVATPFPRLNGLLDGGFPEGRCTALLGTRGGHKSHLGYCHLLSRIRAGERGLVVSLRDDEGFTRRAMEGIVAADTGQARAVNNSELSGWLNNGQLEIMYFPPGYITPEEFFHRLMMGIYRMKYEDRSSNRRVTLLFNSLDQLGARFPLCAKETIFVPSMIHLLTAEEVTSIFVAARERGQPTEYYGLESTAELILTFDRRTILRESYVQAVSSAFDGDIGDFSRLPAQLQTVTFEVSRFAGGQAAGARALLELVDRRRGPLHDLYKKMGLFCVPWSGHTEPEDDRE